jgi:2-polyprenyl-3-methyl-5-hydroxy-6-metoxy-1,4-benzoquinol methylase
LTAYYSEYLENLSEVCVEEIAHRLDFLGDIASSSTTVLEIGGGYGVFAEKLAERGAHVKGYDLSFDQGRVLYTDDPADVPPVDQYDLMVVDERHRGYLALPDTFEVIVVEP